MKKASAIFLLTLLIVSLPLSPWKIFQGVRDSEELITTTGSSINYAQTDPTQKVNRLRIVVTTTSDWSRVLVPADSNILNSKQQLLAGNGTLAVDAAKVMAWGNNWGSSANYQFDVLLSTDGISDGNWEIRQGWGASTHVDIYNTNDSDHLALISSQDCTSTDMVFTVSGSMASQGGPLSAGTIGPKRVFANYYPWWSTRSSWNGIDDPPLVPYGTANEQDVAEIVNSAAELGIDGFFVSWRGLGVEPGSVGTRVLLNVANARSDFSVAVYMATRLANARHSTSCLPDLACQPDPTMIKQWIKDVVTSYAGDPSYLKMEKMINGSVRSVPVINVYWAGNSWQDRLKYGYLTLSQWQQIFSELSAEGIDAYYIADTIDTSYLTVFDGLHSYSLVNSDDAQLNNIVSSRSSETKTYSLLNDSQSQRKLYMGTVSPGINYPQYGEDGVVDRADGEKYRSMWAITSEYNPDWMMITSWNEHYENTHIDATVNYGSFYEDLSRQLITQFKATNTSANLLQDKVYWADYNSYTGRTLNVDYVVNNTGTDTIYDLAIVNMAGNYGVLSASPLPHHVGDIAAGAGKSVSLRWRVPPGVSSFKSYIQAQATTADGVPIYFP